MKSIKYLMLAVASAFMLSSCSEKNVDVDGKLLIAELFVVGRILDRNVDHGVLFIRKSEKRDKRGKREKRSKQNSKNFFQFSISFRACQPRSLYFLFLALLSPFWMLERIRTAKTTVNMIVESALSFGVMGLRVMV